MIRAHRIRLLADSGVAAVLEGSRMSYTLPFCVRPRLALDQNSNTLNTNRTDITFK
jgi:hypothetical protein